MSSALMGVEAQLCQLQQTGKSLNLLILNLIVCRGLTTVIYFLDTKDRRKQYKVFSSKSGTSRAVNKY